MIGEREAPALYLLLPLLLFSGLSGAAVIGPQRDLALLRNRRHGRRTRLERAACERGTCANLRYANTAAGWS